MARINVEDHKKAIFTLNGIPPFEEEMTFNYDESGNCRKFSLTSAIAGPVSSTRTLT